jgi:hypothetical protein
MIRRSILVLSLFSGLAEGLLAQGDFAKGSFGYDKAFLEKHYPDMITLRSKDGKAMVMISPQHQGRVMTSTADGLKGASFGWLNYALLETGRFLTHITPVGGEERFWLGPEGGQFSLYFKKGDPFDYEHWQVPSEIDSKPFGVINTSADKAEFQQHIDLVNYSGTNLRMLVKRTITLMPTDEAFKTLGVKDWKSTRIVSFSSENEVTNTGSESWGERSGMPSIWILSMLNPGPHCTIFIPFKKEGDGKFLTDDYFGKVPPERLKITEGSIMFRADGKYRSKIGLAPFAAMALAGSYDSDTKVLTIVRFSQPGTGKYVNSQWKIQEDPFSGDIINSYNDGPLADGSQMGPFYELESSSPAANLAPGQKLVHRHMTTHIVATEKELDRITRSVFNLPLGKIKNAFK